MYGIQLRVIIQLSFPAKIGFQIQSNLWPRTEQPPPSRPRDHDGNATRHFDEGVGSPDRRVISLAKKQCGSFENNTRLFDQ